MQCVQNCLKYLAIVMAMVPNLLAQSYQSSFSEVKFDRAKGPATMHAGIQVDAATGAASMDIPFGPGIGEHGLKFSPTFSMRLAPQLGITTRDESRMWGMTANGFELWSAPYTIDTLYHRSHGSSSFSPGTFDLALKGVGEPPQTSYSLPGGAGGTVPLDSGSPMSRASAEQLLRRFGYGSSDSLAFLPDYTTKTLKTPFIQSGSSGHLILGIRKSGVSDEAFSDEVQDYIEWEIPKSGGSKWAFPRRILVIQGDIAYEFSYVNHKYTPVDIPYISTKEGMAPLFSAHYLVTKIINRFGESLGFTYDEDGFGYRAVWSRNPQVALRVALVGTGTTSQPCIMPKSMGGGTVRLRVSYEGLSQPVSSYLIELATKGASPLNGGGSPGSAAVADPDGVRMRGGDWDRRLHAVQPISITQEATNETMTFTYSAGPTTTWFNKSVTPNVLTGISLPTYAISLGWKAIPYRPSYDPIGGGEVPIERRPAFAYGVNFIMEGDPKYGAPRVTAHHRVVPTSNWITEVPAPGTMPGPDAWVTTEFYDVIKHPGGMVSVHKFVEPNATAAGMNMASQKHLEREIRYYESGVDWSSDLAVTSPASSKAYKWVVKDRFSSRSVVDNAPVPYATRIRTWDKDSKVFSAEETTDWNTVHRGWTTAHRTRAILSNPSMAFEYKSLDTQGKAYSSPGATLGIEEQSVKTLDSIPAEWFFNRVIGESKSRTADNTGSLASGASLSGAMPPLSKTLDPIFNTLKSATVGGSAGSAVTTTFTSLGSTGLAAAQIKSVALSGSADLFKTGKEGVKNYSYDTSGFLNAIELDPGKGITLTAGQTQDEIGRPITQTDAQGRVSSFTWDSAGRLKSLKPPGEAATTIDYNDVDHRGITLTRGSQVQEFRYNGFGELVLERRQDPNGAWSHRIHGYDRGGRNTGETVWLAGKGEGNEGLWGDVTLVQSVTITETTEGYKACKKWGVSSIGEEVCLAWQVVPPVTTTTTYPAKFKGTSISYDTRGRVIDVIDANGIKTHTAYPASNGTKKIITVGYGSTKAQSTQFESDAQGRLVRVTDALAQKTEYRYDGADRIAQVDQYDTAGHVQTRKWTYNNLGWVTSLTQPESGLTTYSNFTVLGKPKTTSYAGRVVTSTYDATGRPLAILGSDGTVNQALTYDTAANGLGKLAKSVDGSVTLDYAYSSVTGRLTSLKTSVLGTSLTQSFGYDTDGNRISGHTSHAAWAQTYHPATGLPNVLTYGSTTVASTPWSSYDPVSWMLKKIIYGNKVASLFSYGNDQSRLDGITHAPVSGSPLAQWAYQYDEVGNLVRENDVLTGLFDQYSYDSLNRLTQALVQSPTHGEQLQSFTYDAFGNRTMSNTQKVTAWSGSRGASTPTVTTSPLLTLGRVANATFNANDASLYQKNQLPKTTTTGAQTGALYDAQGNLTQVFEQLGDANKLLTLTYDALGRVGSVYSARTGITEKYQYTAEGLRTVIEEYKNGVLQKTRLNLYNDARQLVSQYEKLPSGSLTWKRDTVYLGSREAAEFDAAGMHVTQVDHLGSPRIVTNASGTVEAKQKYLPYGELLEQTGILKTSKGYTNHEQTDASNLIYMQARFYVPWHGRFASPDPGRDQYFEQTQSWNIYSYVRNSPILSTDPTGMNTLEKAPTENPEEARQKAKAAGKTPTVTGAVDGIGHGLQDFENANGVLNTKDRIDKVQSETPSAWQRFKSWLGEFVPSWLNTDPIEPANWEQTKGVTDGGVDSDRSAAQVASANRAGVQEAHATGVRGAELVMDYGLTVGIGTIAARSGAIAGAVIDSGLAGRLQKVIGKSAASKFERAIKKGIVGPTGESGIKVLKGSVNGYTHELKISGSAARLLGKESQDGNLVFDCFLPKGLH